jgi:small subunit ribosomal protein S27e
MAGKFHRVKCSNCENEQILFNRSSIVVHCSECGEALTKSTGGVTIIHGKIIETLSNQ